MWALKYITAIIIPLNIISVIAVTAAVVILAGVIISQRLSLIPLINWGGVLWEQETGRSMRARKVAVLPQSHQQNNKQLWGNSSGELKSR